MKLFDTRERLDAFARQIFAVAKIHIEKNGYFEPMAFLLDAERRPSGEPIPGGHGLISTIISSMDSEEEKNEVSLLLQSTLAMTNADAIVFVSEAWMVRPSSKDPIPSIMPSQHPDRYEVVMLSIEHRVVGAALYEAKIVRNGKKATLGEIGTFGFDGKSVGRFATFFKKADASLS